MAMNTIISFIKCIHAFVVWIMEDSDYHFIE